MWIWDERWEEAVSNFHENLSQPMLCLRRSASDSICCPKCNSGGETATSRCHMKFSTVVVKTRDFFKSPTWAAISWVFVNICSLPLPPRLFFGRQEQPHLGHFSAKLFRPVFFHWYPLTQNGMDLNSFIQLQITIIGGTISNSRLISTCEHNLCFLLKHDTKK